jgi:acyl dehydratase
MKNRLLEDFGVGETFETAARTITEADVVNFAGVSGDFSPIHVDEEFSRHSFFGQRVVHGLLVLVIASGLRTRLGLYDTTLLAFLGIDRLKFRAPVFIGDTIRVRLTVASTRPASAPGRGVLIMSMDVLNQRAEVVLSAETALLLRARASGP